MADLGRGGFHVDQADDPPVIHLRGDLDLAGVAQLEASALRLLEAGERRIVLDCARLDFVDVSGVNALLGLERATRVHGARLVLLRPGTQAVRLLEATGADRVLEVDQPRV